MRPVFLLATNPTGTNESDKWTVLGQADNLTATTHTVELYAIRRTSPAGATQDLAIGGNAPSNAYLNQFMAKAVLQISGVYN